MLSLTCPKKNLKMYLVDCIQSNLAVSCQNVIAVATSAIEAKMFKVGIFFQSAFNIPVHCCAEDTYHISVYSNDAETLLEMSWIIYDEIVMCHRHCIEALESSLKCIMHNTHPYCGKVVLFAGDFHCILWVVLVVSRAQNVITCVKLSFLYQVFQISRLTGTMRIRTLLQGPAAF